MNKKYFKWLVLALFVLMPLLLFYKSFLGYAMQGTDLSFGLVKKLSELSRHTTAIWFDDIWFGFKSSNFPVDPYTLFLKIASPYWAIFMTYAFAVFISLLFSYLLLRRWKLSLFSSIFGAVAYSFTPTLITLISALHIGVIEMLALPPMLFYFLTIAFDQNEKERFKTVFAVVLSGIVWGLLMNEDVQRGLYISIIAVFFVLVQIATGCGIKFKTIVKDLSNKKVAGEFLKIVFVGVFLVLTFFNGLNGWLPTLAARNNIQNKSVETSNAAEKWNFSTMWSFHPTELIDNLAFGYHGNLSGDPKAPYWGSKEFAGNSESMGFFVLLFALISIIFGFKKNYLVRLFSIAGILALLFSFGRFWPGLPFYWIFYHLPLMSNFRAPAKFVSVAAFAFSLLAAFGVEQIIILMKENAEELTGKMKKLFIGLGIFIGIGLIWMLVVAVTSSDLAFSLNQKLQTLGSVAVDNIILSLLRMIIFTAAALILFFLIYHYKNNSKIVTASIAGFILLLFIDLWSIDSFYTGKAYFKESEFYQTDGVIDFLSKDYNNEIFRVATCLMFPSKDQAAPLPILGARSFYLIYSFPYYKIQPMDISSTSGSYPEYNNFFIKPLIGSIKKPLQTAEDVININLRLLQLANIKYLVTDGYLYGIAAQPIPIYQILTNNSNFIQKTIVSGAGERPHAIFEVKNYLPRVGFYENYQTVASNEEALNYIGNTDFHLDQALVVHAGLSTSMSSSNKVLPLKISDYHAWSSLIQADVPNDGVVLFNSKYDPEWHAYIDGKRTPTFEADYQLTGVFINKGSHRLEFRFEPDLKLMMVTLVTILFGFLLTGAYFIRKLILHFKSR
jgi:hypothetical protein